jgi:pimeloyl-ACP methyl ester carboxylesterase
MILLEFLKFCGKSMLAVSAFGLGMIVLFVLPVFFIAPSSEYDPNPIKTAYIPTPESVRDHPEILSQAVVAPNFFKFDKTLITSFVEAAAAREGRDLPTIVYLHGGPLGELSGLEMEWVARLAYPHRVLYYQQPGSGVSARLKGYADLGSLASQIEWLNTFVSAKSEKPVIIIAHSFGTFIASHFAAKHPDKVRAMLFLGPSYPLSEANLQQDMADAAGLAK